MIRLHQQFFQIRLHANVELCVWQTGRLEDEEWKLHKFGGLACFVAADELLNLLEVALQQPELFLPLF